TVKTTRVSESGNVSLPLIGTIKASGLTEAELEKVIAQTYKDKNIIQSAQVAVTVIEARQRTFSILGAVGRPGQYQIVQADFKLLDALTLAGDVQIQGIDHVYVIRKLGGNPDRPKTPAGGATTPPAGTTTPDAPKTPVDPLRGPQGRASGVRGPVLMTLLDEKDEAGERKVMIDGKWVPVKGTAGEAPKAPAVTGNVAAPIAPETGKVVDPLTGGTTTGGAATGGTATGGTAEVGGFQFDAPKVDSDVEIIKVPYGRLRKGDLQYNIVIRPNDTIDVPSPTVGEYYMGGHVGRPGVYSLTGRDITLKQAIISAGMIDPLGWPERTEVVRRIGKDKEIFVRVNLPQVFAGQQPDIFLRPYDVVSVGSNMVTPFLAALRGAFRFTYGFGFIYDRNYAPEQSSQN
ncbi:MAG: polysaccharide biosynthesis/export family protein, partial [Phycisphaerae bacterium]